MCGATKDLRSSSVPARLFRGPGQARPSRSTQNSTVIFQSAHTYSGETLVNAGTLRFTGSGKAGNSDIRLGDTTATGAAAKIQIASGVTLDTTNSKVLVIRPGSSGTKTIESTATSGTATLSRNTFLDADLTTLSASGGTLLISSSTFDLKNQTLTVTGAGNTTISSTITNGTGSGKITKNDGGVLTISNDNKQSGTTTLNAGTLRIGDNNALGTGNFTINGGTFAGNDANARTITNAITMGGNVTLGDATGTGNLTLSNINLNAATRQFTVGNNTTVAGVISNGASAAGLTKAGNGTLTLNGANTYTGTTTVNAGAVALGASAAIAGNVTVSGGTFTLGNNNQIGNTAVAVSSGTLNFGGFTDGVSSFNISSSGVFTNGTLTATSYVLNGGTVGGTLGNTSGAATNTGNTSLTGLLQSTNLVVSGGTLTLGSADRMIDTLAATVSGGTLNLNSFSDQVGSFTISSGVFTNGTLTAGSYALNGGTARRHPWRRHGHIVLGHNNVERCSQRRAHFERRQRDHDRSQQTRRCRRSHRELRHADCWR